MVYRILKVDVCKYLVDIRSNKMMTRLLKGEGLISEHKKCNNKKNEN